jgi:hypothetical protein
VGKHIHGHHPEEKKSMLRKSIIALAAVAMLGGVALAPTTASAGWRVHHGHHYHGWGWRVFAGPRYFPADCYWVKKYTPFGVKFIRVCGYL